MGRNCNNSSHRLTLSVFLFMMTVCIRNRDPYVLFYNVKIMDVSVIFQLEKGLSIFSCLMEYSISLCPILRFFARESVCYRNTPLHHSWIEKTMMRGSPRRITLLIRTLLLFSLFYCNHRRHYQGHDMHIVFQY
jgi:hypothetical protein